MGRTAYKGKAPHFAANPDHPWADIMNAARKVRLLPNPDDGRLGEHHHHRRR